MPECGDIAMFEIRFDWGEPYRWRANLRMLLPGFLGWLAPKGEDCEVVGAAHQWYNIDNQNSGCYHCEQERKGRLWESSLKVAGE